MMMRMDLLEEKMSDGCNEKVLNETLEEVLMIPSIPRTNNSENVHFDGD